MFRLFDQLIHSLEHRIQEPPLFGEVKAVPIPGLLFHLDLSSYRQKPEKGIQMDTIIWIVPSAILAVSITPRVTLMGHQG